MATKMDAAKLDLVEAGTPGAQRVAVLQEPYRIEMRHARIPEPGPDEVRIKVRYVGICGSDLESYRGLRRPEFLSTPARLGHEVSGVIDKLGANVRGLEVGARVTCRYVWGAFAEYIVCKPFNIHTVPDHLDDRDISPIEVLPGVLNAAEMANVSLHTDVLIMGQGVSGLVLTQVLSMLSPRNLVVTDLQDHKLALARKYGATHTFKIPDPQTPTMDVIGEHFPDGLEVVIPALLDGDGMVDAMEAAAFGGRIILYGCIGVCKKPFDWLKVHRKRLTIAATEPRRDIDMRRYFDESIRLVEQGLVNLSEMITHTYPLDEIAEAFAHRDRQGDESIHILVDCGA